MKKPKILLVDDDVKNSTLLCRFIEAEGYDVTCVHDGLAGYDAYLTLHPELILLDVNMPGLDGFDLAKRIRQMDRRVIIFFLTDRTDKVDRLHGFSLKGNDYIPKPFYPEELMAKISERFENMGAPHDEELMLGDTLFSPVLSTLTYAGETTRSPSDRPKSSLSSPRPPADRSSATRYFGAFGETRAMPIHSHSTSRSPTSAACSPTPGSPLLRSKNGDTSSVYLKNIQFVGQHVSFPDFMRLLYICVDFYTSSPY